MDTDDKNVRDAALLPIMDKIAEEYPDREFVLLIGADNWARFDEWFAAKDILANHHIVVYPREGTRLDASSLPPGVTLADTGLIPGSSTEIRCLIANNQPIDGLVPPVVAEFIRKNKLYRNKFDW